MRNFFKSFLMAVFILFLTFNISHATNRLEMPIFQGFDLDGAPLSGGLLYSYEPGTSTAKATYTDIGGATPHANPIVLDSQGFSSNGSAILPVYLIGSYKLILKNSSGVTQWTIDNIQGIGGPGTFYGNPYYVDASEVDIGATGNGSSLKDIIDSVGGSNFAYIIFRNSDQDDETTYTLSTSEVVTDNFYIIMEDGAVISRDSGKSITINGQLEANPVKIFTGTGTTIFGTGIKSQKEIELNWYPITVDGSTDTDDDIQAAITSCGAGSALLVRKHTSNYFLDGDPALIMKDRVDLEGIGLPIFESEADPPPSPTSRTIIHVTSSNDSATNLTIKGIKFISDVVTKNSHVIGIGLPHDTSNITVKECEFEYLSYGVKIDNVGDINTKVIDCIFNEVAMIEPEMERRPSTVYNVDDVIVYPDKVDGTFRSYICTTGGTTSSNRYEYSLYEASGPTTDGTAVFTEVQTESLQGSAAIFVNGTNTLITGCTGTDIGGLRVDHFVYSGPNQRNTKVSDCYVQFLGGFGVSCASSSFQPTTIVNLTVKDCHGAVSGPGAIATNVSVVSQNNPNGSSFFLGEESVVTGCRVDGYVNTCFTIPPDCIIANNLIISNSGGYGIGFASKGNDCTGALLEGNVFIGTGTTGTTRAGFFGQMGIGGAIRGNYFEDVVTGGGNPVIEIAGKEDVVIDGNTFYSTDGDDFHDVLVDISTGASDLKIINNNAHYVTNTGTLEYDLSAMSSANANSSYFKNNIIYNNSTQNIPSVASATSIIVNSNSGVVKITGTTNIQTIDGTNRKRGETLILSFGGSLDLIAAGNIALPSMPLSVTANDVVQLVFIDSNWRQVSELQAH